MSDDVSPKPTADVRLRLMEVAEEVFAEKGFAGASVREICAKANVNIAAINYHFGGKERLYIETVKRAHTCSSGVNGLPPWPDGPPPADKLRLFIREMVHRMVVPISPTSLRLLMREMAVPSAATREVVRDFIQPMAFALHGILRELMPGADERRLLMVGFSVIGQCLYYRQNRPVSELLFGREHVDALSSDAIAEHVERFTLAALGHAEPIRPADLAAPLPGGSS